MPKPGIDHGEVNREQMIKTRIQTKQFGNFSLILDKFMWIDESIAHYVGYDDNLQLYFLIKYSRKMITKKNLLSVKSQYVNFY